MKTPEYAHSQFGRFKKHWKNYYYSSKNTEEKINNFVSPNKAQAHHYPLHIELHQNELLTQKCKQISGRYR